MGCGKSSVGRKLSELLCCRFMDLDDCIVETAGCSIPEIFSQQGETEFRKLEQAILKRIVSDSNSGKTVLALGGGAVMTAGSEDIVHEGTICIYLKASVDTLIEHLSGETAGRPMLNQSPVVTNDNSSVMSSNSPSVMSNEVETSPLRARILELMSRRAASYERTAHIIIDTDGKTIEAIAAEIITKTALHPNS
jgi:shikimate kinase